MKKEITLPVAELKEALPGLKKIIGSSRTLPVLQTVRVTRDQKGDVRLQATDLDSWATYTLKEQQPGAVADLLVGMDQLTKAIKSSSAKEDIGISSEGKEKVRIRYNIAGNQVEQTISTIDVKEFPPVPEVSEAVFPVEPEFGKTLKQALNCCSDDASRYVLRGACLDVTDKKLHYIIGTNGHCLFSANSFCFPLEKSVIIPDSKFLNWSDLMEDPAFALGVKHGEPEQEAKQGKPAKQSVAGWVKFQSPRWTFITKEIDGQFPNWKQVVPDATAKWTRVILSAEAIQQMLLVIPNMPGGELPNSPIKLRVDTHLTLDGRNGEDEKWTTIPVTAVNVNGKPVEVMLNRDYLLKALRFNMDRMEIEDSLSPVVFSDRRRKLVVMPIRMEGDAPTPPANSSPHQHEQATPQPSTEAQPERTETQMPRTSTANRIPDTGLQTQNAEHQNGNGNGTVNGNGSAVKSVAEHIEKIKDTLKEVIRSLSDVTDALKQAEKEKKTSDKEIEAIRAKLRQIQNVTI